MDLAEGLDELRVGILRDSSTLKSGPPDKYWSDDMLVRYIQDAHSRFARMALCIRDSTTPLVTQVKLAAGVDTYSLHKAVLMVVSARHQDDQHDMVRVNHLGAVNTQNNFTEDFQFALVTAPGKPTRFTTDEGMDVSAAGYSSHAIQLRVLGVPDSTQDGKIIYLRTIRKPLHKVSLDDTKRPFEIPEDYHLDMLEWGAYRARRNWDIDSQDVPRADIHKTRFEEAVKECRADVMRKMWQPLHWGFGANGFSYVKN